MWVCSVGGGTEQGKRGGVWGAERYMWGGQEASGAGDTEQERVKGAGGRVWVCSVGGGTEQGERGGVWGVERYMCRGGGGQGNGGEQGG